MPLAQRDEQTHTYGEYLTWPEDVRYELIDGIAYLMAPAPDLAHQEIAGEIFRQLANVLRDQPCRAYIAPVDVRIPKTDQSDDDIDTVLQPDVLVVCEPSKLDRRGVRGAPDFIVEVLSPSSAAHDHARKRRVYERAGVREYWLVHPTDRMVTVYRLEGTDFGKPLVQELSGSTEVAILPGVQVEWDDLVERLPPADA